MGAYDVLSERELESRYEVFVEQYIAKLNIEAETTFSMAKTLLLPPRCATWASWRRRASRPAWPRSPPRSPGSSTSSSCGSASSQTANMSHPEIEDVLDKAKYVQGTVVPAMAAVREVADQLERVVPDSLWPLPKYSRDPLHQVATQGES